MKSLLTLMIFYSCACYSQTRMPLFELGNGKTRTLSVTERYLLIDMLTLGDNSTIIVPPEMDGWTVIANEAVIGKNVTIMASGSAGVGGGYGYPGVNGEKGGAKPTGGSIGGRGDDGKPGKNIHLTLNIRSIGSLVVITNGGAGGPGGQGGIGGNGANGYCLFSSSESSIVPAQDGAGGGPGGHGGNGGNAGNIKIGYHLIHGVVIPDITTRFITSSNGGPCGAQGRAGGGGQGGDGAKCRSKKTNKGTHGPAGAAWDKERKYAQEGKSGVVEVLEI
jgi:hypothetical protein